MYQNRWSYRKLSQNFLKSRKLIKKLVGFSLICKNDLVYEIGPGRGIITEELAKKAGKVIAIEIDSNLVRHLKEKFKDNSYVEVINQDFLQFQIYANHYKVFSNLPFSVEGKIIRKLLDTKNQPFEAFLIMQKEVAKRLAGYPREGEFSILHKPWFEFEIIHHFSKFDFQPISKVDSVLLKISKRKEALLPYSHKRLYERFVNTGFRGGKRLGDNLKKLMDKSRFQQAARVAGFSANTKPSDLSLPKWIKFFNSQSHLS